MTCTKQERRQMMNNDSPQQERVASQGTGHLWPSLPKHDEMLGVKVGEEEQGTPSNEIRTYLADTID